MEEKDAICAIKMAIRNAEKFKIRYHEDDFNMYPHSASHKNKGWVNNYVMILKNECDVTLSFKDGERGKKLKALKDNFLEYHNAIIGKDSIEFRFTEAQIQIELASDDVTEDQMEKAIAKIQKILALADKNKNPSEEEAIAASLAAQKLLAKYNLEMSQVTGEEKKEEIESVYADCGNGNSWKNALAQVIARSYCCKLYLQGSTQVVFYGYRSDAVIARKIFMYLFNTGKKLAAKFVKDYKLCHNDINGVYNMYLNGYIKGIDSELSRQCTALALIVPEEVDDKYKEFTKGFKSHVTSMKVNRNAVSAYNEGYTEGKRALTAQYIQ